MQLQAPSYCSPLPQAAGLLVQEVLQRLRQRRMSRLSHSQHEIQGILQCSEPEEGGMSDSADELNDPAGQNPAAGPEAAQAGQVDQPDMEDMGALAHELHDAGMEEQQRPQQPAGEPSPWVCHQPSLSLPLSLSIVCFMSSTCGRQDQDMCFWCQSSSDCLVGVSISTLKSLIQADRSVRSLPCLPQLLFLLHDRSVHSVLCLCIAVLLM